MPAQTVSLPLALPGSAVPNIGVTVSRTGQRQIAQYTKHKPQRAVTAPDRRIELPAAMLVGLRSARAFDFFSQRAIRRRRSALAPYLA